jgi:hypothetical protein
VLKARKQPKTTLVRARAFVLCADLVVVLLLFVLLSSGFPYSVSMRTQTLGLLGLTALIFVFVLLPVSWKRLGEDLARYRLARWQVIGGKKMVPHVGTGLAIIAAFSFIPFWFSPGRNGSDVLQKIAVPFTVTMVVYTLVSFWIVDRKAMQQLTGLARVPLHP